MHAYAGPGSNGRLDASRTTHALAGPRLPGNFKSRPAKSNAIGVSRRRSNPGHAAEKAAAALRARNLLDLEKIQKEYIKELSVGHGEAVKPAHLAEAQAMLATIQSIQNEMESKKLTAATVPFRKGSRWQGTNSQNGRVYPASLTVTSRSRDKFDGILQWKHEAAGPVSVLVEGKIDGEISFEMKKVQSGKNVIFAVTYAGKLTTKSMKGTWRNPEQTVRGEFSYVHHP